MRHFFIINPCAGGENRANAIASQIKALGFDVTVYITRSVKDATRYVSECCQQHPNEALRFYACGGDGTLNEVVSGAIGHPNAEVGCYPSGSGNDYVKYWHEADFHNLQALSKAPSVEVDVMKVCYQPAGAVGKETCYGLNTLNYGFEAEVCRAMDEVRRKPLIGGRMSYTTAIVRSLASGRHNPCRITVDGNVWKEGDLLLASLANGRYEGGGFLSAPRSENNDGLLEVTAIQPISIVRFASIVGYYKRGEHLDRPKLQHIVSYCRARCVSIESDRQFYIGIDGELLSGTRFEIENLPRALRFLVPTT